jgi:anaerobic selenocysteine-containing dehydrogenase
VGRRQPVSSPSGPEPLAARLAAPETIIVHEPWWTAADIVLPATTSLERNDLGGAPRDRFVIAMHKAIEPVGNARNDFDIFLDLSRRLGCEESFAEGRDESLWLRDIWGAFRERAKKPSTTLRKLPNGIVTPAKALRHSRIPGRRIVAQAPTAGYFRPLDGGGSGWR